MQTDFNNGLVDGLMPAMIVFLAHQGYTIDSIHYVAVDGSGTLHERKPGDASGVQITYFRGDRDNLRVLVYLQADLSNDGLSGNPGYVRLMRRLGPGVTYLKAASYLLYENYFSDIRNAILADSIGVVEDDSGIPLRDFNLDTWSVTAYGNYTGPITLFKQYFQPDLTDLLRQDLSLRAALRQWLQVRRLGLVAACCDGRSSLAVHPELVEGSAPAWRARHPIESILWELIPRQARDDGGGNIAVCSTIAWRSTATLIYSAADSTAAGRARSDISPRCGARAECRAR